MKHIFKPFRNYMRKFDPVSFLRGIYYLSNHLEWDVPLPPYLKDANPRGKKGLIAKGFFQWELDTLAREAILHGDYVAGKPVAHWGHIREALRHLRETENNALKVDEFNVLAEMPRIAHRQFHWQNGFSQIVFNRYRRTYSHPGLDAAIQFEFGITVEQFFLGSLALITNFLTEEAFSDEFDRNVSKMLGFPLTTIIERFSTTLPELKKASIELQSLDQDWAYTFHPLRANPLIRLDGGKRVICPVPGLLTRRFTDGLYFDIGRVKDALSDHLGPSFQSYVGDVLHAARKDRFSVLPEEKYGTAKKPNDTVDWIVEDESAVLFIECKLMRMANVGREKMAPLPSIETQHRKIAKAIGQLYANLTDALDGLYPNWKPNGKHIFPLLVTMDNWLLFSPNLISDVHSLVKEHLDALKVSQDLLEKYPYAICCINELENASQVISQVGVDKVMRGITFGPKAGYMFHGYLFEEFGAEMARVEALFPDDRDEYMARLIKFGANQ